MGFRVTKSMDDELPRASRLSASRKRLGEPAVEESAVCSMRGRACDIPVVDGHGGDPRSLATGGVGRRSGGRDHVPRTTVMLGI